MTSRNSDLAEQTSLQQAHKPVLVQEICFFWQDLWKQKEGGAGPQNIFVDLTFGAGGHYRALKEVWKVHSPEKKWIYVGIDRDEQSLNTARKFYSSDLEQKILYLLHGNSENWLQLLNQQALAASNVAAVLMDCGLSSMQIDQGLRGFSFQNDGPLDMRMDVSQTLSAEIVVNTYNQQELTNVFRQYGELDCAYSLAGAIIERRKKKNFSTTFELKNFLDTLPLLQYLRRKTPNIATQPFQAIRIEVNQELEILQRTCQTLAENLSAPASLALISFHSLEDRIIKNFLQYEALDCLCNKKLSPICNCGKKARIKLPKNKMQVPGAQEIAENSRSRSAKVRFAFCI